MELSNPNLQSCDFPLFNVSDSQIQNPSYSLSIPSEPPQLGNWFSSYEYESPALDSNDNFRVSIPEEREAKTDEIFIDVTKRGKEGSLRAAEEKRKKDYVLFGADKEEKQSSTENIDSYYSCPLTSEPIDVKNWFSSYAYESPALDTSDGFKDSLCKESECEEGGLMAEESNREMAEGYGEFERTRTRDDTESSNGLVNCGKYCRNSKQEKQLLSKDDHKSGDGKHVSSDKYVCFESTLKQCSNYETLQNHGIDPDKEVELATMGREGPRCKLNFSHEISIMPLNMRGRTCNIDIKLSEKLTRRMENVKDLEAKGRKEAAGRLSPKSNPKSVLVSEESTRKSSHGCEDRENGGQEITKDGFVTTRKGTFRNENAENLQKTPKETGKWKVSQPGGRDSVVERKVLSERTNFHHPGAMEITGKWQCPQKRKPNLGPPMKQLRLERWIQRA